MVTGVSLDAMGWSSSVRLRLALLARIAGGLHRSLPTPYGVLAPSIANSQARWAPGFGSGAGWARLFPSFPSKMRGVTRREDALSGLRRTARTITPGGPGSPDPGASADAPRQLGAPRGISRFRVHGQSDRARGLCAAGRLPECRPGRRLMLSRPRR